MATQLGPLELFVEKTIQNSSTVVISLVNGNIISGVVENSVVSTTVVQGVSVPDITRNPFTYFVEVDLNTNFDIKSLVINARSFDASSQPIVTNLGNTGTFSFGAKDAVIVKKGLWAMGGRDLKGWQEYEANSRSASVRVNFPTLFSVLSNTSIDKTTGVFNKKLYLTVFFIPKITLIGEFTKTIPPYSVIISVSGKQIIETIPPPSIPPPTNNTPTTPPSTPTTPTIPTIPTSPTIPEIDDIPDDPDEEYIPPEETQLSVRCIDETSQSLYGVLPGSEFESEYIENTRQAIRVCEQIIWQANQTLIFIFSIPYDPTVRRGQTIQIQSNIYIDQGFAIDQLALIKSVSHVFDTQTGEVTTQIIARGTEYIFESSLAESDPSEKLDERQE